MKRILTALISIVLLFTHITTAFADGFNIVVDSKSAKAGDMVEINISFENNTGIIATIFSLEYDRERIELVDNKNGNILEGGIFSKDFNTYPYKMVWNSASDTNFTDDGVLTTLKFRVLDNAPSGKAFIRLLYNENDVFDVDLNNVAVNVINGEIDVLGEKEETNDGLVYKPSASSATLNPVNGKNVTEKSVKEKIVLTIGKKEAMVFGEIKTNDVPPVVVKGRTMLPARFVAENLGASVEWDKKNRMVTVTKDDIEIIIEVDSNIAFMNGEAVVLDSPAFIQNSRTYTPLRFIAEKLGAKVEWKDETKEVTIIK